MDAVRNPFAPGAGNPPPELAGRAALLDEGLVVVRRTMQSRPTQSLILVGLRGVGKTVLLVRLRELADQEGLRTALVEAHEGKSLAALLAPDLRSMLFSLSMVETAKEQARRGLRVLKGFMGALKISLGDLDLEIGVDPERGTADTGDIENDLPNLLVTVAQAAAAAGRGVALFIDELQYLEQREFSALIMSMHRISQSRLPLVLLGAGLPQVLALAGDSKSYAERLFRYPLIGPLDAAAASDAIVNPIREEEADITEDAVRAILQITRSYPYFLQQWGHDCWNVSTESIITETDVAEATVSAIQTLDQGFFKVRFDRCTPSERRYMRALAELGAGPQRSGDVAQVLGMKSATVGFTRNNLIRKGMVYAPSYGETEFTVPLFDEYMRRTMPLEQ